MIATADSGSVMWTLGEESSFAVKEIAENGNNGPMLDLMRRDRFDGTVFDWVQATSTGTLPGPLVGPNNPGAASFPASVTFRIRANPANDRLSYTSMLVCTNDGFTGVDAMQLPRAMGKLVTVDTPCCVYAKVGDICSDIRQRRRIAPLCCPSPEESFPA